MTRPLEGIRVLDCGWIIAGPLATRLLSDFGAEVIKIESYARPDRARGNRMPLFGDLPGDANANADTGGYFQDVNAGKLSCSLNLASEKGRELLLRLVAVSDAIVTNLGGGDQLDRWGLRHEVIRALNPRLIVVTVPTMESRGPRSRWHSVGDSFNAMSGLKSVSGYEADYGEPFGHHYPDFSANPFHAAIALMAALHHRERTGEGQFVEVSQYESTASMLGAAVLEYTANGGVARSRANRNPDMAPHNFYRCRGDEAWCAIAIESDAQWLRLAALPGLETLRQPRFATLAGRQAGEAEIDAIIQGWTTGWDRHELASFLQSRGVPAGPYQGSADLVDRDPVLGDAYFEKLRHPIGRDFLVHGSPVVASRNPAEVKLGPLSGEHTMYVLKDILGLAEDEVAEYAAAGALD